uniref:Variant surface glycoprotein 1125.1206 n=1 Tax=Trypanosoma brucei TaxID=5691 RepID=A0A1J0R6K3_9TRYP|nr:variant surface glycoprotein 1125.1206 [Trypanosoma brucei]
MQRETKIRRPALLLLATVLTAIDYARYGLAAEPTKGENAELYSALCTVVNALTAESRSKQPAPLNGDTLETVNLLKLFLRAPQTVSELAAASDAQDMLKNAEGPLKEICPTAEQDNCLKAAAYLKARGTTIWATLVKQTQHVSPILPEINATVKELASKIAVYISAAPNSDTGEAELLLHKAFLGTAADDASVRLTDAATNRQTTCGISETIAGKAAGKSIAEDLICICGSNSNKENKGCLATGSPNPTYSADDADHATCWQALKAGCSTFNPGNKTVSAEKLKAVAAKIRHLINEPHGNDQKISYLGYSDSVTTAAACDGKTDSGCKGACVTYGKAGGKSKEPEWLGKLVVTAEAMENKQAASATKTAQFAEINNLNKTLANLLHLHNTQVELSKEIKQSRGTETEKSTKTLEKTNKDCEAITKAAECKKKKPLCECKGENVDDGPHCKWNETHVE